MAKAPDPIIINSEHGYKAAIKQLWDLWREHKYVTLVVRLGAKRSLDQNNLAHLWMSQYIAYVLGKHYKEVTTAELEGIKRTLKRVYYLQTGHAFMVHMVKDYESGTEAPAWTSTKHWTRGEMFDFLCWFQMKAAEDGCLLESKGEFQHFQQKQVA